MDTNSVRPASSTAGAIGLAAHAMAAHAPNAVDELIAKLKGPDDQARTKAWFHAGPLGAQAIPPLAALWAEAQAKLEVRRAAGRAVAKIVRYAARPGAEAEKQAVLAPLQQVAKADGPVQVRRELLGLVSEVAGDESGPVLAALLKHEALRQDACMTLERIPGERSLTALQDALPTASADFKPVLAAALRHRGRTVSDVPDRRLVPSAQTKVPALPQP